MPRRSRSTGDSTTTSPKRRRSARIHATTSMWSDMWNSFTSMARSWRDAALGGSDQSGRRLNVNEDEFREHNNALKDITNDSTETVTELRAVKLDFLVTENRKEHHTEEYEIQDLIVRRGQEFIVNITFDREYNTTSDDLILQFVTGSHPMESKGTVIRIPVDDLDTKSCDQWHAVVQSKDENTLKVGVTASSDAIIGKYHLFVETQVKGEGDEVLQNRKEFETVFMILFNPWCKEDDTFLEVEDERYEYVLNDNGRIWQGVSYRNSGTPWYFGQYEDVVLEAVLALLDLAELADGARSNPKQICRTLSAMANSNDDDHGILTGRWSETYPKDSTVPWAWTGSVGIIEEYMKTKKAVKFGQCWVFSGLLTTLCRAVGIPTRSVTNFQSAHDCDESMTIDYHWNEDDDPVTEYNDSVWNFHVWNEAWFKRRDLPQGNDGWQAFDSTPQELSEGVMRCGPAPVNAIKEGNVHLMYDTPFVFAEVNGDKVHWQVKADGSMSVLGIEHNVIGKNISTKAIGSNRKKVITNHYKHAEGSEEERRAVARAFRHSTRGKHNIYEVPEPDVSFKLNVPDDTPLGKDFTLKGVAKSNSDEETRHVTMRLTAVVSYYTGVPSEKIVAKTFEMELKPNEEGSIEFPIEHDSYDHLLKLDSTVTVYMKATVKETKRCYATLESFYLTKPELIMEGSDEVTNDGKYDLTVKFTNPLSYKLTGGVFHVEGLSKSQVIHHRAAIKPDEEITHKISLTPGRSGTREVYVNFSCDQMAGISGNKDVYVKYPPMDTS